MAAVTQKLGDAGEKVALKFLHSEDKDSSRLGGNTSGLMRTFMLYVQRG
jgi:hypothetical protein